MRSSIIIAAVLLAASVTTAEARKRQAGAIDCDMRGCFSRMAEAPQARAPRPAHSVRARHHRASKAAKSRKPVSPLVPATEKAPVLRGSLAKAEAQVDQPLAALADTARLYIGKTASQLGLPTSLWCSDFLNMITGGGTHDRMARSWLSRPKLEKPVIGAVVVFSRGRSGVYGHVGVLTGWDKGGNPIVVAGNAGGNRVRESRHKGRVLAYVMPPLPKPAGVLEAGFTAAAWG